MEIYTDERSAERMIAIAKSFNIDAQIVGRTEPAKSNMLEIIGEWGKEIYWFSVLFKSSSLWLASQGTC